MRAKWIEENNVHNNYKYIKLIFESFNLKENIDFFLDYDDAIRFKRWRNGHEQNFRIILNEKLCALMIYMRSIKNNLRQKEKYHVYKDYNGKPILFRGSDAWYDCIKMLVRGD